MIMAHSDDDGLVLPPKIAASQLVIIPIIHNEDARAQVMQECEQIAEMLKPLNVIIDKRDLRSGEKSWGWIKKGVPLRLEIGLREVGAEQLNFLRRDMPHKQAHPVARNALKQGVEKLLDEMQANLLKKAAAFRDQHTVEIHNEKDFYAFFTAKGEEIHGGFALCYWDEDPKMEAKIKEDLNVTSRCIPLSETHRGKCIFSGKPNTRRVIFAKAY
jgi:prolyl-tRNA synthetase